MFLLRIAKMKSHYISLFFSLFSSLAFSTFSVCVCPFFNLFLLLLPLTLVFLQPSSLSPYVCVCVPDSLSSPSFSSSSFLSIRYATTCSQPSAVRMAKSASIKSALRMAYNNFSFNTALDEYLGRLSEKKHVWATGKKSSGRSSARGWGAVNLKCIGNSNAVAGNRERPEQKLMNCCRSSTSISSRTCQKSWV